MRWLILLSLTLGSVIAEAAPKMEAVVCLWCSNATAAPRARTARAPERIRLPFRRAHVKPNPKYKYRPLARSCYRVLDKNQNYGDWGKDIARGFKASPHFKAMMNSDLLKDMCPRYTLRSFSTENKVKAWVGYLMALGNAESSCDPDADHAAVVKRGRRSIRINPYRGYGMWTVEYSDQLRSRRGPECYDVGTLEKQTRCVTAMLHDTQLERGKPLSIYAGYFGPNRPNRIYNQIERNMTWLKFCN